MDERKGVSQNRFEYGRSHPERVPYHIGADIFTEHKEGVCALGRYR